MNVADIRSLLESEYQRVGSDAPMIELIGSSFTADASSILRKSNTDYIRREIAWYMTVDRNLRSMKAPVPEIWRQVADDYGNVNSQYGYLFMSVGNGTQLRYIVDELRRNKDSRRAVAIYTRPTMHTDAFEDGMNDFICTNAVNYFIRNDALHAVVQMRSNDAVFGYPNDLAWQRFALNLVRDRLARTYGNILIGTITWQAASLHVYPRHYGLLT